jgi:DNA-binding response OmpR family regulator
MSAQSAEAGPVKLGSISPLLIVEDNYLASVELSRLLDELAVETRATARMVMARELAREMRPKVALIDINLEGGFEGLTLARELQALYGTKIVFVTGYHVRDLMHRLTGADNMAVIFKPIEREVLTAVLTQVCTTISGAN